MHLSLPLLNFPLALAGLGIWSNIYVKKPQLSERSEFCGFSKYCSKSRKNQVKPRSLLLSSDGKEGRRQAIRQATSINLCSNSSRHITDNCSDNLRR